MPRLRRILLFLLLGATANILVALACARFAPISPRSPWDFADNVVQSAPADAAEFVSDPKFLASLPTDPTATLKHLEWNTGISTHTIYSRQRVMDVRESPTRRSLTPLDFRDHGTHTFGLPCRSMSFTSRGEYGDNGSVQSVHWRAKGWRGGWPIPSMDMFPLESFVVTTNVDDTKGELGISRLTVPGTRIYPLVPLPLGFTLNTLFYAALLFLPFAAFTTLRRRRRIRRNLCLSCGYSLAGAVPTNNTITCPECGKPSACDGASP